MKDQALRGLTKGMSISPRQAPQLFVLRRSNAFRQGVLSRHFQSLLVGTLILICGPLAARGNYRYWTDATGDNLWSNPGNWSPKIAPISGDILVLGDPNNDNGKRNGFTINDIPNLNVQELILGDDTDSFTLESTVGPLYIYGQLAMNNAGNHVGLYVECPLVIENGGSISIQTPKNSAAINFDAPVEFTHGGSLTALGADSHDSVC